MTQANDARRIVLQSVFPVQTESCSLDEALNRVLAQDLNAPHAVPPFDSSGMDGYAVKSSEATEAHIPVTFSLQGEIAAGRPFSGTLLPKHALRIMTGAPIPEGADAVIEQEAVTQTNGSVEITGTVAKGRNIRQRGEDMQEGSLVLARGTRLNAASCGIAASLGRVSLPVYRIVRVAVLATGNEIVNSSEDPGPGQIRNSNGVTLAASVKQNGFAVRSLGIARDNDTELSKKIESAWDSDAIITSGGVSVGDHDRVLKVLEGLGVEVLFWKVNIKPGMPMAFGVKKFADRSVPVFALPGNPVSTLVTFRMFVLPGLRRMSGEEASPEPLVLKARLGENLVKNDGKRHFVRGICRNDEGELVVSSTGNQSSAVLTSLARANCLIVLPEEIRNPRAGDPVGIILL